ncbi:MAG: hypothetical protein JSR64_02875 [Nitrospira sp.]|nr:hypothetical protein [Nitrospira sp.]
MAIASDLMGLGLPGPLAQYLSFNNLAVTTTGTSATDAYALGPDVSFVTLTTASSQTGVKFHANTPLLRPIIITNPTSTTGIVYPSTSGTLNGGTATTGGQNLAQNKTAVYFRVSANVWVSILTA